MIKKIFNLCKKIIASSVLIYAYDSLSLGLNVFIPINVITVMIVSLFGGLGMVAIVILSFLI